MSGQRQTGKVVPASLELHPGATWLPFTARQKAVLAHRGHTAEADGAHGCVGQIDSYEKLYEEVSKCENTKVFHGWLQCDCRPFKQALLNTIKRWSFLFKRHLSNHVVNR